MCVCVMTLVMFEMVEFVCCCLGCSVCVCVIVWMCWMFVDVSSVVRKCC